ncbi:MAG: O-antigen ligase family protein [Corticimicrobacter sp.]|uniref:O-antigen ligase family protein n=1 Tax=Corticimicrobacter sp. TaxID=2678536 RepID=UPI0032D9D117
MRIYKTPEILMTGLAGSMFWAVMVSQSLPSALFYVILAVGLWLIFSRLGKLRAKAILNQRLFFYVAALPVLAILIDSAGHADLLSSGLERALRQCLGIVVFVLAFSVVPHHYLKCALLGVPLAITAAFFYVFYLSFPDFSRPETGVYNAVGYGSLMFLLSMFAVCSFSVDLTRHVVVERWVKIFTVILGLFGFLLTQTRTGWMAFPIFLVLGVLIYRDSQQSTAGVLRKWLVVIGASIALAILLANVVPGISDRIQQGIHETAECTGDGANRDTSVCIRVQLWRASIGMWSEHTWFGVGSNAAFRENLQIQYERGVISEFTATNFGEPHNDMLYALAVYGIPGWLALVAMYFVPGYIFVRRLWMSSDIATRSYAAMGAALCLGFFIFGWTEFMFRGIRTLSFYTLMIALFAALSAPISAAAQIQPRNR